MFDNLTARLARAVETLRGRGRITEENVAEALREVRMALLEADVALPVVKSFIDGGQGEGARRRGGHQPDARARPSSASCTRAGRAHGRRSAAASRCTCSRRRWCCWPACRAPARPPPRPSWRAGSSRRERKRVLLVSTDVRRPAAMLQLERLAEQVQARTTSRRRRRRQPAAIARAALERGAPRRV